MNIFVLIIALASIEFLSAQGEDYREFTNKDGRTIRAKLEWVKASEVGIKMPDGRTFALKIESLSEADQDYIAAYLKMRQVQETDEKPEENSEGGEETDKKAAADLARAKILSFAKENMGEAVGNGECWTLANEAFKAAGIKRPGADVSVWGREIDIKKEEILPGDIVEFDNADLGGGMKIDGLHTAIVAKVKRRGAVEVYQQNTQHGKIVTCDPMDLGGLISGIVKVYRYE
jgi:hypothetical protein